MKVLNLYAGLGGNRKLWQNVEVTAVEIDSEIAQLYKNNFPDDIVIIGDAHQYLLDHYKEFDFIWSSYPCTTHTRMNVNFNIVRFPDLKLYEEIIFLKTFFKGLFCVENVIPYYGNEGLPIPGLPAQQYNRHLFWCNFKIKVTDKRNPPKQIQNIIAQKTKRKRKNYDGEIVNIKSTQPHFGFDLSGVKLKTRKDKILRNCVDPEIGLMILDCALNIEKTTQKTIFDELIINSL
jgi:DNA (cytosine-5)-methyltransferase 1